MTIDSDDAYSPSNDIANPIGHHAGLYGTEISAFPGRVIGALACDHIAHDTHRSGNGADNKAWQINQR
jgi:hypothetical protein